jgi:hypothetical protein
MGIFGFGKTKMAGAGPYMGAELGTAESPMHSGYVKGYGMGEARSSGGASRMPGEMTSARQYADVPISQRATTSRGMTPGQTRSLLAKRGQLRGLEGKGTVPAAGTRSAGRPVKTNPGGRPVANGYGSLVNHRQAAAQAQASAAARDNMGLSGRGTRANPHNAGGYRGMTKESYKRANAAERAAVTGGGRRPGRVTQFAGGGSPPRLPGGALKGVPASAAASGMNAPIVPAMPSNPSLIGQLGQIQGGGYAGVVGDSVRKVQQETRAARAPMRANMLQQAKNHPSYTGARRGMPASGAISGSGAMTHTPPAPLMHGPPAPIDNLLRETGKTTAKKPLMKSFKNNKALMIGAGAAVIAGLAMNRRGEGTSSGRSGMTRY